MTDRPFMDAEVVVELTKESVRSLNPGYDMENDDAKQGHASEAARQIASKAMLRILDVSGVAFSFSTSPFEGFCEHMPQTNTFFFQCGARAFVTRVRSLPSGEIIAIGRVESATVPRDGDRSCPQVP